MNVTGGIGDHPDLRDSKWIKQANRRAKREIRRSRRRARLRAHSGKLVSAVSLVVIAGVLFGLYRAGEIKFGVPESAPVALTGVQLDQPFVGTPAQDWADGEAGIRPPDANPEFAPVYDQVKKAIVAARLDSKVLTDHDPRALLALVHQEEHAWVRDTLPSLTTRLEQGRRLLSVAPKVDGRMRAEKNAEGAIVVHTTYRFAYAFQPDNAQALQRQYEMVAMVRADASYTATNNGSLWISEVQGFSYSMSCKASKAGYLAPMFADSYIGHDGDFDEEKWYGADAPMPTEDGCK